MPSPRRSRARPIPKDRRGIVPRLSFTDSARALAWYKKAFGAVELMRFPLPDGSIAHAEMKIGDAVFALTDVAAHPGDPTPKQLGGHTAVLCLYVRDVDAFAKRAAVQGAKIIFAVADHFYGDRAGRFEDPFGHSWSVGTRRENVSVPEVKRRIKAMMKPSQP